MYPSLSIPQQTLASTGQNAQDRDTALRPSTGSSSSAFRRHATQLLLRRSATLARTRMRIHALSLSLSRRLPASGCTRRYTLRPNAQHQPYTGEAPCVACVHRIGRSPSDALRLRAQDIERRDSVEQQKPTRLCECGSDITHAQHMRPKRLPSRPFCRGQSTSKARAGVVAPCFAARRSLRESKHSIPPCSSCTAGSASLARELVDARRGTSECLATPTPPPCSAMQTTRPTIVSFV